MERWAANTLRGIGIAIAAIVSICGSLILLLFSMCFWKSGTSPDSNRAILPLIGAVAVLALGVFVVARLVRAMIRSGATADQSQTPALDLPIRVSPASEEALQHLSYAIGALIAFGILSWAYSMQRMWSNFGNGTHGAFPQRTWLIVALVTTALHYLPYVIVLFRLQKKPDRATLAFSMGIPIAGILQTASTLLPLLRLFSTQATYSQALLSIGVALVFEIAVIALAWRANQSLGYRQDAASIGAAVAAAYLYFMIFGAANTWMYRFIR